MNAKIFLFLVGLFMSVNAHAELDWLISDAEIVSVGTFYDGYNHVLQLKFKASPSNVNTSALNSAPTWSDGETTASDVMTMAWWSDSTPHSRIQSQYSTALSAQAQKLPVDLHLDTSRCASTSAKPYGNFWTGIRFSE